MPPQTSYQYRIRALNQSGSSSYATSSIVSTYSEYEASKDQNRHEIDASDLSDQDGDGLPLLLEYALLLSPRRDSIRGIPTVSYENGVLSLKYYRARNDLNYSVETSVDLIHWTTQGVTQEAEILGLFVTAQVAASGSERRYLRLVVTEK